MGSTSILAAKKGNSISDKDRNEILRLKDVSFSYLHLVPIIKRVNFKINKGEIRAIIGPNGAGKSTLMNLISGRNKPTSGQIIYNGTDIARLKPYQIRHLGISRSFQITNIFDSHTVYENVRLAVQAMTKERYNCWKSITGYEHIRNETLKILSDIHLIEVAHLPVRSLSYAQKRLLEIALSLAGSPSLILLDEPAAGLSIEESQWMARIIKEIAKTFELSVVFIEHDMDVVFSISDYITVLHYGEIVAEDVPQNIKENQLVQEIYLGNQGG